MRKKKKTYIIKELVYQEEKSGRDSVGSEASGYTLGSE